MSRTSSPPSSPPSSPSSSPSSSSSSNPLTSFAPKPLSETESMPRSLYPSAEKYAGDILCPGCPMLISSSTSCISDGSMLCGVPFGEVGEVSRPSTPVPGPRLDVPENSRSLPTRPTRPTRLLIFVTPIATPLVTPLPAVWPIRVTSLVTPMTLSNVCLNIVPTESVTWNRSLRFLKNSQTGSDAHSAGFPRTCWRYSGKRAAKRVARVSAECPGPSDDSWQSLGVRRAKGERTTARGQLPTVQRHTPSLHVARREIAVEVSLRW